MRRYQAQHRGIISAWKRNGESSEKAWRRGSISWRQQYRKRRYTPKKKAARRSGKIIMPGVMAKRGAAAAAAAAAGARVASAPQRIEFDQRRRHQHHGENQRDDGIENGSNGRRHGMIMHNVAAT
jgi:hypothetical protein